MKRIFKIHVHGQNVDDCWHCCQGNLVKLWTQLKNEGYSGLSNIAFGIWPCLQRMPAVKEHSPL